MLPLDFIRIAKHDATVIGAYRFQPINALMYQILSLRVIEPYRGRGIGRWLLAHALGVIESKGGRVIAAQNNAANQLFHRHGLPARW